MRRLVNTLMVSAALVAVAAVPASAQIKWNLGLGMNLPQGDLADFAENGLSARVGATFGAPMAPISFRVEGGYDMWKMTADDAESFNMLSGSADAVYSLPGVAVKPYILGGLNWNQLGSSVDGTDKESGIGFNVGAGLNFGLGGLAAYVEARYVKVSINDGDDDVSNFPIVVGLRF